jgi:hypothetical protein
MREQKKKSSATQINMKIFQTCQSIHQQKYSIATNNYFFIFVSEQQVDEQQPPWENAKHLNQYYIQQLLHRTSIDNDCCSIIAEYLTCDRWSVGEQCLYLWRIPNGPLKWCYQTIDQIIGDEYVTK